MQWTLVVVEMGPEGVSLAATVTVLDGVHERRLQEDSVTFVGARVTDRSVPTVGALVGAHPFSSEMKRNRPLLLIE